MIIDKTSAANATENTSLEGNETCNWIKLTPIRNDSALSNIPCRISLMGLSFAKPPCNRDNLALF